MGALGESATAHELVSWHRCPSRKYAVRVATCLARAVATALLGETPHKGLRAANGRLSAWYASSI